MPTIQSHRTAETAVDRKRFCGDIRRSHSGLLVSVVSSARLKMIIEVALFLLFVAIAGAFVVKAYEWRQDVLYGPYIRQNDWKK